MKPFGCIFLISAAAISANAQQWEFGGSAGAGFLPGVNVSSTLGAATAGFQSGINVGAFAGQNLYPHIGGEIRYGFAQSNLKLQSGGTTATFSGVSHAIHYDLLLHTNKAESKTQFFAAFGGGMKIFRGTGRESAYQPLSQYAYFTKTQAVKPMASVGGGVRYQLGERLYLRAEFRDYITPFPKDLITPAPGAKIGTLLHDFVPMVGISYEY
jgi:hypothetical protein